MPEQNNHPPQSDTEHLTNRSSEHRRISLTSMLMVRRLLVLFWRLASYILATIILGGILVNLLVQILNTGSFDVQSVQTSLLITWILANPALSALVSGILAGLLALSYIAQRIDFQERASAAEHSEAGTEEQDEQKVRAFARRLILGHWAKSDQELWKSLHDMVIESQMQQVKTWIADDPALLADMSDLLQRNRPHSIRRTVIEAGQVTAFLVTLAATGVSIVLAIKK